MARIPDADIARLKEEVSVQRLVESSGVALRKTGKDFAGCCPFHEDDTASLIVTPAKNLWHCFGCGAAGGPIDWVMRKNGVSFRHAVELLREGISSLAAGEGAIKRTTVRKLEAPVAHDADDVQLLAQVVAYYHETLKRSPDALAYLAARGIDHPEALTIFQLGFADRSLGLRLPNKQRKEGLAMRSRLERLGVMRAESGHEHLRGSLVIPLCDGDGQVVNLYGRKIADKLKPGTPKHLYLPEARRSVWNLAALIAHPEIILCEALIDALTFWCAGYRNVTTAYGTEGFGDELLDAFRTHGTKRVLIAFDRDDPGERAAEKVAERLLAAGIECFRIQFPKGMDANEYALKLQPAQRSLGIVIRKALWMGQGAAPVLAAEPVAEALPAPLVTAAPAPTPVAPPENLPPLLAAEVVASPVPPAPAEIAAPTVTDNAVHFNFGERRYRVRGLAKNTGGDVLKINLLASRGEGEAMSFFVDTLDLYSARQRAAFVTQAALELQLSDDCVRADLGRVLRQLEDLQDQALQQTLTPQEVSAVALSAEDQAAALELLRSPDLLTRIADDFAAIGLVGERTNKLVAYLAAVSRKLDAPLAIVVQSSSAAGKSSLMDAVLALMPEEERIKLSAMTGQSLFYMGETNLKHKILAICEEEGASRASYALKVLQSDGELSIASTGKDPATGNLITQQYRVEGPVMIFLTTTAIEIDEELLNRCLVLSVDESRAQTEAIHRLQRQKRTLTGLLAKQARSALVTLHQNAQRLLRPLAVVNPYADQLTFLSDKTRTRRDHEKYLTLIDTIALLHQYQRPIQRLPGQSVEYLEVTLADIAAANAIAHEVLGRSLDELPPQTRRLLGELTRLVEARCRQEETTRAALRFTRREVRAATGWSDTQLRVHLARLTEMEYLIVHRGARGQTFEYELLYDAEAAPLGDGEGSAAPHLSGLLDPSTMPTSRGETPGFAGPTRPQRAPEAAPSRPASLAAEPVLAGADSESSSALLNSLGSSLHRVAVVGVPAVVPSLAA